MSYDARSEEGGGPVERVLENLSSGSERVIPVMARYRVRHDAEIADQVNDMVAEGGGVWHETEVD